MNRFKKKFLFHCSSKAANNYLRALMSTLETMKQMLDGQHSISDDVIGRDVVLHYTDTEEKWLQLQFSKMQSQFKKVQFSQADLMPVIDLLTSKKPLPHETVPAYINLMAERCRLVLKMFPEFSNLSDENQIWLLQNNTMKTIGLSILHVSVLQVVPSNQCGHIGNFILSDRFSFKSSPNIW